MSKTLVRTHTVQWFRLFINEAKIVRIMNDFVHVQDRIANKNKLMSNLECRTGAVMFSYCVFTPV